jgi:hypothetical protein
MPRHNTGRFELDYWGPSYKQAIEQVLGQDSRPVITTSIHNLPGELKVKALPPDLRKRVRIVPIEQADYFFTNFRISTCSVLPIPKWHLFVSTGESAFGLSGTLKARSMTARFPRINERRAVKSRAYSRFRRLAILSRRGNVA